MDEMDLILPFSENRENPNPILVAASLNVVGWMGRLLRWRGSALDRMDLYGSAVEISQDRRGVLMTFSEDAESRWRGRLCLEGYRAILESQKYSYGPLIHSPCNCALL